MVPLGAALGAAGVIGIKTASQLEQANIGFTTMLGSGQKAQAFLDKLAKFAEKTPFEFTDVTRASQRLMAMGVSADKVIPYLTAIGDAVSGLGGGKDEINQVTTAIGQMTAKTKIQGDEILQLTEAGIPALRILADSYGVSTDQMQDMITKGKVLSDDAVPRLIAGMENGTKSVQGFGGMMEAQSHSIAGVWSNLADTVTLNLAKAVEPILPLLKGVMQQATPIIGGLLSATADGLQTAVGWLQSTFAPALQGVFDLVVNGDFTGKLAQAFNIQEDNPIVGFVLDARDKVAHIWDGLGNLWASLDMGGFADKVWEAVKGAGGKLIDGLVAGFTTGNWKPLGEAIINVLGTALSGIASLAAKVGAALSALITSIDWGTLALEFGKQVPTLILGLVTGILNFDFGSIWNFVVNNWFELLMAAVGIFFLPAKLAGKIGELLTKIPLVGKFLEWGWTAIKGLIDAIGGWVGDVISAFWKGLTNGEGGRIAAAIAGWFNNVWTHLFIWADDLLKWFGAIPGKIADLAGNIGSVIGEKLSLALAYVRDFFGQIVGWIGEQLGIALAYVRDFFGQIAGWILDRVSLAAAYVRDFFTQIAGFVLEKLSLAAAYARDLGQQIRDWIVQKFTDLRDAAVALVQNVVDWVSVRFVALRDFVVNIAQNIRDWVVQRITALRDDVVNLAQNIWDWVAARFTAMRDTLVNIAQNIWDWVYGKFIGMRDGLVGVAQNIWDWLTDKFTRTKDSIVGIFTDLVSAVAKVWDGIKKVAAAPIKFVLETVLQKGLFAGWDSLMGFLHLDSLKIGNPGWLSSAISAVTLATGGTVPGYSPNDKADNIPAMLTAGEYVQPVATHEYYGTGVMDAIRQRKIPRDAFQHLADGGPVYQQLFNFVKSKFPRARMNDGFRPGASDLHGAGLAVDLGEEGFSGGAGRPYLADMKNYLYRNFKSGILELIYTGLGNATPNVKNGQDHAYNAATNAGHTNHVHLAAQSLAAMLGGKGGAGGAPGGASSALDLLGQLTSSITGPIKKLGEMFGNSPFVQAAAAVPGKLIENMWTKVKDVAEQFMASFVLDGQDREVADTGGIKSDVSAVAQNRGWQMGTSQWPAIDWIVQKESGWNPKAKNPSSSASGLFQQVDGTWLANRPIGSAAAHARDARVVEQAQAGLKYIASRYGTPLGAQSFWKAHNYYHDGGPVGLYDSGGLLQHGGVAVNKSGKPERVLSPEQTAAFDRLASNGGGLHVENIIIQPASGESTREQMSEVTWQLRKIARGGGLGR